MRNKKKFGVGVLQAKKSWEPLPLSLNFGWGLDSLKKDIPTYQDISILNALETTQFSLLSTVETPKPNFFSLIVLTAEAVLETNLTQVYFC
jgi:hypothetical protein